MDLPKKIYKELLENRAHFLTDNQVLLFEQLFNDLKEGSQGAELTFKPQFKA